ncbi:MAG TPA: DNA mismatch endonuclease Vsr [Chryseosolibacter sp.]
MADVFSKQKRSAIMASVKSSETKPEILVRKFLHSRGFRFRKNVKDLPGKPDVVMSRYNVVILIHGCFWHGHEGCKGYRLPKTRLNYWSEKIRGNIGRDKITKRKLIALGFKVITVWECSLKKKRTFDALEKKIRTPRTKLMIK